MENSIYPEFRAPDDDHAADALRYFSSWLADEHPEETATQLRAKAMNDHKERVARLMIDAAFPDD